MCSKSGTRYSDLIDFHRVYGRFGGVGAWFSGCSIARNGVLCREACVFMGDGARKVSGGFTVELFGRCGVIHRRNLPKIKVVGSEGLFAAGE